MLRIIIIIQIIMILIIGFNIMNDKGYILRLMGKYQLHLHGTTSTHPPPPTPTPTPPHPNPRESSAADCFPGRFI